ncbi:MAG: hypothetical protein JNN20_01765 [Betaproteobacteria bacterium]|nr:hypothetical protein [Betaproteobacteria bacterium]
MAKSFAITGAARRTLAVLLLLAQLLSLFVAPMHRIAHAAIKPVEQAAQGALSAKAIHSHSLSLDWFGHEAGSGCDDWNAAFAHDANPADASPNIPSTSIALPVDTGRAVTFTDSHPAGLSRARAPPRR